MLCLDLQFGSDDEDLDNKNPFSIPRIPEEDEDLREESSTSLARKGSEGILVKKKMKHLSKHLDRAGLAIMQTRQRAQGLQGKRACEGKNEENRSAKSLQLQCCNFTVVML